MDPAPDQPPLPPLAPPPPPPHEQTLLEQYLAQCDELCPSCGYNLRHLRGGQCPECGDRLKLHVGLVDPRRGPFVAGLIALASGAGFSGLLLLYAMIYFGFQGRGGPRGWDFVTLFGEVLFSSILIWLWLRHAARLRRMNASTHWLLAALCWVSPPLNLAVFMAVVR